MRTRTYVTVVAGFVAAGIVGAATASAATPFAVPQAGVVGVELNTGETQALANSPVPALVDRYVPKDQVTVATMPDSGLPQDADYVYAPLKDIVGEAGSKPGGGVDVAYGPGVGLVIVQNW
ncbi:hypothetical protein [Nocardia sp. NPDC050406]|uniref:hypothetical protein n=1 Tax=Nocardia sp. NPDC050406 TaxID=3364318 RepID=UPI003797BE3F